MSNKIIKTSVEQIAECWREIIDKYNLNITSDEATERCWRCGHEMNLERCHIIPRSLGGEDTASNFVLLCKRCHSEAPNIDNYDIMWDWIKSSKITFRDIFWINEACKKYEEIYGQNVYKELCERAILNTDEFMRLAHKSAVSNHFGQDYINTMTVVGQLRNIILNTEKKFELSEEEFRLSSPYL
ncbi:HNH endonuclease [Clostridium sp. Marseille-Q7071]